MDSTVAGCPVKGKSCWKNAHFRHCNCRLRDFQGFVGGLFQNPAILRLLYVQGGHHDFRRTDQPPAGRKGSLSGEIGKYAAGIPAIRFQMVDKRLCPGTGQTVEAQRSVRRNSGQAGEGGAVRQQSGNRFRRTGSPKQFCPSACGIRRRQRNPENHRHYSAVLRGIDCIAVAFPDWKHRYMYFRDALPFVWASVLDGKAQSRVLVRLGMVLSRYAVSLSGYRNSVDSDFPNGRL